MTGGFSSFFRNEVILRMVPSLLIFSLGSACSGTGGGGAGLMGCAVPAVERVGDISPKVDVSKTGIEIMGLAVEPGFGGGNAGAPCGGAGAFLANVPFIGLSGLALMGGGGAALCGGSTTFSCSVGCT